MLARSDDAVIVSINYRLGIFGFLALPSLSAEAPDGASGDYGLLDQEAALGWVHRNIGAFGGNPANVTIAGESAGGYSVCALLASPAVRGLFSRAIIESGSCASQSLAAAEQNGSAFAKAAGCTDAGSAAACLRRLPAAALLDDPDYPTVETPTFGGSELPLAPASAVSTRRIAHVPVLIGTNRDEGRTFSLSYAYDSEQAYVAAVQSGYGSLAPQILARYEWTSFPSPYRTAYALGAVWTDSGEIDGIGGCAARSLARELSARAATYFYEFDDRDAPGLDETVPAYQWGAGHAMELAYLWPSFYDTSPIYPRLNSGQRALSDAMVNYWGAFIRSGAPEVAGQATWPRYGSGGVLSLRPGAGASTAISDAQFSTEHRCGFWDALPGEPG